MPFEQLVPIGHLRVPGVLDLDPVRASAVCVIGSVDRFRYDAKVARAGHLEEISAPPRGVVHVQQPGRH
jgi:hypothetical protein